MKATVRLQREPFDAAAEAAILTRGRSDVGAAVTFTGICRGDEDGQPIAALTFRRDFWQETIARDPRDLACRQLFFRTAEW